MKGPIVCLSCGAEVTQSTRGCCIPCYQRHRRDVLRGIVTWEELEHYGITIPPCFHFTSAAERQQRAFALCIVDHNPFYDL